MAQFEEPSEKVDVKNQTAEDAAVSILQFSRNCRIFIGYINYDWEQDLAWTSFQEKNMKDVTADKEIEEIKREYYKQNVNEKIAKNFSFDTEEQKKEFIEVCKYMGNILGLNEVFKS